MLNVEGSANVCASYLIKMLDSQMAQLWKSTQQVQIGSQEIVPTHWSYQKTAPPT